MTRPVEPGELIGGKYEIVRRIGKGGMGVVFEARHATIGRRLAIKFLRSDLASDEKRLRRFEREARTCGALHHENIAAVFDFGKDELERPYIVMEFVEGPTLRELLDTRAPLDVERASGLIRQAALGLSAAHEAGILHRDLKPENLMLTRRADGTDWVKLLDFGVSRLAEDADATALTREGQTPGTPHYLAPEIARGELPASATTDVYSLGVVSFELLTGQRPHPDGNYHAVLRHVSDHPAPPVAELRPDLPDRVAHLIDRTLSRDTLARPRSALEFLTDLQAPRAGLQDAATVTSAGERAPEHSPSPANHASSSARRRNRLLLLAGLVVAVSAGLSLWRPEPTPSRSVAMQRFSGFRVTKPPRRPALPDATGAALAATASVSAGDRAPRLVRSESPEHRPALGGPDTPGLSSGASPSTSAPDAQTAAGSFDRQNPFRE